ncbi:31525_t:CDS:1, partial [Gigaspora margarita]
MDVEQETEGANTVSEGETSLEGYSNSESANKSNQQLANKRRKLSKKGRPRHSFIWKYYKTDQAEGFHYCDVEVPVSSEHPDGKCSHKFQIT